MSDSGSTGRFPALALDAPRMRVDDRFFPRGDDFHGLRVHQIRLRGGDASSGSYCFR